MRFRDYELLEWLKRYERKAEYNLGSSAVRSINLKELGAIDEFDLGYGEIEGSMELKGLIAECYDCKEDNVALTSGVNESNFLLFSTLQREDEVIIETPTFPPIQEVPKALGLKVKSIERRYDERYQINAEALEGMVSSKTRMVVVTNLHNPSGILTDLRPLVEIVEDYDAYLFVDEIYRELSGTESALSLSSNVVVTSSLSKTYGSAGLRIGWVVGDEKIIKDVQTAKNYVNTCLPTLSEHLAIRIFKRRNEIIERARNIISKNISIVEQWADSRDDIDMVRSQGTICFPRFKRDADSLTLGEFLFKRYSTLIVPGRFFGAEKHFRLGIGGDVRILAKALDNISLALDSFPDKD